MYLKGLTIKGFKSFADATTLQLEPGVTVVVGPNGSGKSNVVDAIAWVLGAQAPSIVRSQKMDDVIFAGAAKRAALGRAEVTLTIDNADGVLPIEFSEVTITRVLFRSGDSEYAINGSPCRLLDIQELLSDSGVGRQQHIIISQGQIDGVLNARPEDRRSIVEEAAGVLKYRKRKERAERRLDSAEENLQRLTDMAREVRRQLKPLEKQAAAARRHDSLLAELRAAKTYLVGTELKALRHAAEATHRSKIDLTAVEADLQRRLAALDAAILEGEAELAALGGSDTAELLATARSLRERVRGVGNVVAERRRRLDGELRNAVDDDVVASLEAEAVELADGLAETDRIAARLEPEYDDLTATEADHRAAEAEFDEQWGDGPGAAPTRGAELRATISSVQAGARRDQSELDRLGNQVTALTGRRERLERERAEAEAAFADAEPRVPALEARVVELTAERDALDARVGEARTAASEADASSARWQARADALAQALDDARSAAGADALAGAEGVLGTLLDLIEVDEGWEPAVEAAIGEALRAVVVDGVDHARAALESLSRDELTGAVVALGVAPVASSSLPAVGRPIRPRVRAIRPDVEPLLDRLLGAAVAVDGGWPAALDLAVAHPDLVVVSDTGDRFGPGRWQLGSGGAGATGAALADARAEAERATAAVQAARAALAEVETRRQEIREARRRAEQEHAAAVSARDRARQRLDGIAPQLEALAADGAETDARLEEIRGRRDRAAEREAELAAELAEAEAEEARHAEREAAYRRGRAELADRARAIAAVRKDLEVRAAQAAERRDVLESRRATVEARLAHLVREREEARVRREELVAAGARVDAMAEGVVGLGERLEGWLASLEREHREQSEAAREVSARLATSRRDRQDAERRLTEARAGLQKAEVDEAEHRVRIENLTEKLRLELDLEPEAALEAPYPEVPEGVTPKARLRDLERELKSLGPINPLAIEEYAEVAERDEFLQSQITDVRSTRSELQKLIRSVDAEIVNVFGAAFADVAENFQHLFGVLFPGGTGAVRLVGEDDLLNCGIEIDAKPSGKNVKKLSLLSGGERSLVALAFLFAVFRSRPSPFYVMDEVEAALDDMNLTRFLALVGEFRKDAQLLIVSHQKRTMEAADVLYGVSMKPGGSSKVVSEKAAESLAREGAATIDLRDDAPTPSG